MLFVCADDLNEDISPYNQLKEKNDPFYQTVYTPNVERLASQSLLLACVYNQYPFCNPSRSSLLTGRRHNTTHVYNLKILFREVGILPQFLSTSRRMAMLLLVRYRKSVSWPLRRYGSYLLVWAICYFWTRPLLEGRWHRHKSCNRRWKVLASLTRWRAFARAR